MKVNKMKMVKNAVIGFGAGVMWELMIISPNMSGWSLRSIIVALMVSGLGCSVAGALLSVGKKNMSEKTKAAVEEV